MLRVRARIHQRVDELGRVGLIFVKFIPKNIDDNFLDRSLGDQARVINSIIREQGTLAAAAVSLLVCDVVFQVRVTDPEICMLVSESFTDIRHIDELKLESERKEKFFPLKPIKAANVKVNISFSDAYESLCRLDKSLAEKVQYWSGHMKGLYNDEAASLILAASCFRTYYSEPVKLAVQMLLEPSNCKSLTTVLKSLGLNSTRVGAVVCESLSLKGRLTGTLDLVKEVKKRIGKIGIQNTPNMFSDMELESAITKILNLEIDRSKVVFEDVDVFWSKRWSWCVNGGHSKTVGREVPLWDVKEPGQIHRRVAMEHWTLNPMDYWVGDVFVSSIEKLEHGKTRLILSCDTVSYTCFEHFLSGVEKSWKNKRILLDPGSLGMTGIARRVNDLGGGINVMMDYDDFNSQHTLRAMKLLFKVVGRYCNYDEAYLDRLVNSFDRTYAYVGGARVGRIVATLMSGHRGTTFINSILNAAYIIAAAPALWDKDCYASLHTGDDIVSTFSSYEDIGHLLKALKDRGCRLNALKQSVGIYCKEFLRMAITKTGAIGYAMRSVASVVSGNWVTENSLNSRDLLTSVITSARALINRSGDTLPAELLVRSVCFKTGFGRKAVRELLLGEAALGEGPVYMLRTGVFRRYDIVNKSLELSEDGEPMAHNATSSYLSNHVSDIELVALGLTGRSVFKTMLEASYAKSRSRSKLINPSDFELRRSRYKLDIRGAVSVGALLDRKKIPGVLSRYPVIVMVREHLTDDDLRVLVRMCGREPGKLVDQVAFGAVAKNVYVRGCIPYSDACNLSSRTSCGVIVVTYNIFM